MSGLVIFMSWAISPGVDMPISAIIHWSSSVSRSNCSGNPKVLLKLPSDFPGLPTDRHKGRQNFLGGGFAHATG